MSADVHVPSRPRGRPRRAAARAAIVRATLELLGEGGFQAATMDAIAARAGVGKNTIYRRWDSKEDLIADALVELGSELDPTKEGDPLRAPPRAPARPGAGVRRPAGGAAPPRAPGRAPGQPEFAAAWADRVVRPRRDAIVELLAHARERGRLRDDVDLELVADLLIGPPFLRIMFLFGAPAMAERYADDQLEAIWRGSRATS